MTISAAAKSKFIENKFSSDDLTNQNEDRSFIKTALAWKGSVTPKIISRIFFTGIYSSLVVLLGKYFPNFYLSITPFEYSGAVLGLLLVARVNSGMDRWWEARKIWGSIVNQSRNLAIIGHQYSNENSSSRGEFLRWVALWPLTMKEHLRDGKDLSEGRGLIEPEELARIKSAAHMPMFIGTRIANLLKSMREQGLDDFSFQRAERERALLIDAIGACERIKSTPIPLVLAIKTRRFIFIFLVLLPFALVNNVEWMTPFIVMLTAYPLFCLDEIGVELQSPFSTSSLSHLPLNIICNNIKMNVLSLEHMKLESNNFDKGNFFKLATQEKNTQQRLGDQVMEAPV